MRHSFLKGLLGCSNRRCNRAKSSFYSNMQPWPPRAAAQKTYENWQDPKEWETTHTNITLGQGERDSMELVHWFHNCLLSSQQSLSHRRSQGKQHSQQVCPLGFTSQDRVDDIREKKLWFHTSSSSTDLENTHQFTQTLQGRGDEAPPKESHCQCEFSSILIWLKMVLINSFPQKFGSQRF